MENNLQQKINELEQRIKTLENSSLSFPISPSGAGSLNQSFISSFFERFNVRRLFFTTGQSVNPSVEGEMVYHESSKTLKVRLGNIVRTITTT